MSETTDVNSDSDLSPELREEIHLAFPPMHNLTDAECNRFRALPCSFNDMVRYIWEAGYCAAPTPYAVAAFMQGRAARRAAPPSAPEVTDAMVEAAAKVRHGSAWTPETDDVPGTDRLWYIAVRREIRDMLMAALNAKGGA